MPVIECDPSEARSRLSAAGADFEPGNTEHEQWRATLDGGIAVAYADSIVIQGTAPDRIRAVLAEQGGRVHVYFDGASHGNPGPAAIGWVLVTDEGILTEGNDRIGRATNNEAEYAALIRALEVAAEYGFAEVQIRGDSELIIKQVTGEYDVTAPTLQEHRVTVHELLRDFEKWSLTHVPRAVNDRADELATQALHDE